MTSERAATRKNDRKNDGGKNADKTKSATAKNADRTRTRAERRHQELMTALIAVLSTRNNHSNGQDELIRTLQQTIDDLRAENERLRQQNGNGDSSQSS